MFHILGLILLSTLFPGPQNRPMLYKDKLFVAPPPSVKVYRPYDIRHYKINITVDVPHDSIWGYTEVTVMAQEDNVNTFTLYLVGLTIDSIVNGDISCSYTRLDSILNITLPSTLNQGDSTKVTIFYHGIPTIGGGVFGGGLHITSDIVYVDDEPWGAKRWFPCLDAPDDKGTSELIITVPQDQELVGNGVLVETSSSNGWKTYHWVESYPIATYLIVFASSPTYVRGDTFYMYQGDTLPIYFWAFQQDSADAVIRFQHTPDMIDCFTNVYMPYPFLGEKYSHVEAPIGGAMENQTNTFIVFGSWGDDWDWVVAHELSHQWWGDMVTCGTWADIWLNEGFATYSEAIYYGWRDGEQAYHNYMKYNIMDYFLYEEDNFPFPIYDPDYLFTPVTYEKAASVLHMLRHVVGDSTFFDILRTYGTQFAYRSAETQDFIDVAESVSGEDLEWFFDEWLYQIGHPEYYYIWNSEDVGPDSFKVSLSLSQIQSHTGGVPTFTMPIDVGIVTASGDTIVKTIWNQEDEENYVLWVNSPPKSVILDPHNWILCEKEGHPKVAEERRIIGTPVQISINTNLSTGYLEGILTLNKSSRVNLSLFDISGRKVGNIIAGTLPRGNHRIDYNWPKSLHKGLYFLVLRDGTGKVIKSVRLLHLP